MIFALKELMAHRLPDSANNTILFRFCFLIKVAPEAYGSSQAKGRIGAAAAGLHHSHSNAVSLTH